MKQLLLLSASFLIVLLPNFSFTVVHEERIAADIEVQNWFIAEHTSLENHLVQLKSLCDSNAGISEIQQEYRETRAVFKRIEFVIAYIDPELYATYINGAPLPKLMKKVPDVVVIEPTGFQRIDELIYEDSLDRKTIALQVETLRQNLKSITPAHIQLQLTDPVIFESIRFGLIRLNTMGVTGFDSPGNTDFAMNEVAISLEGMKHVLEMYRPFLPEFDYRQFEQLFESGIAFVRNSTFEKLDRAAFHKNYADPLWREFLVFQKALQVELPFQRMNSQMPVNYESSSMFANDFLQADFYAQYALDVRDPNRVELGKLLFFDPVLSSNNSRACASCHQPDKAFTDGKAKSITITNESGNRNAPTIINSVFAEKFFHDFRVDALAAQMDHVVFNPEEFNTDYKAIVAKLKKSPEYLALFKQAYGEEGITKNSVTHAVTRYVASLQRFNSPFDQYMRGELAEIDKSVIRGYNLFTGKAACATCHFAPTFAGLVPPNYVESESEVLGVPTAFEKPYVLDDDPGRYMNRILKEQVPFYKYSFKTPTLRNIELTGPYMHNGSFETLEDVLTFYNEGGGIGLGMVVPHQTLPEDALNLTAREQKDVISFMKALTDTTGLTSAPLQLPRFENSEVPNNRVIGGAY